MITDKVSDDTDIKREMNILLRRYGTGNVHSASNLHAFNHFVCFYDLCSFNMFNTMMACYVQCIKSYLKFGQPDSVTDSFRFASI